MTIECAFSGHLGTDPELRTSQAGKPWARFRVGVGEGETSQWVSVSCFGTVAERAAERLHKGDRCYVEGTLKLEHWTDSQGNPRSGLKVAAWRVDAQGQIGARKPARSAPRLGSNPLTRDWQQPAEPADAEAS